MFKPLALAALSAATLLSMPVTADAAPKGCPPGLAKKHNGCNPPGHAAKHNNRKERRERVIIHRYDRGERIANNYVLIERPTRYGLPAGTYYRVGDDVYRVNRDTREVLDFIGAFAALVD